MNNLTEAEIREIRERCDKATPGEYEYSTFTHHSGREMETVQDVADTTSFSALQGTRSELFGVALSEKDEQGRNIVVAYTGNGPNAHNNANFLAHAKSDIAKLLAAREEMQATFDIRWDADMRAIKQWQEKTGRTLVWPDHADLCVGLLDERETLTGIVRELLQSSDASWYENWGGHDWREAYDRAVDYVENLQTPDAAGTK